MSALGRLLPLSARSGADWDTRQRSPHRTVSSSSAMRSPLGGVSGANAGRLRAPILCKMLRDAVTMADGRACLPFDLTEVATNLRQERYRQNGYNLLQKSTTGAAARAPVLLAAAVPGRRRAQAPQKVRLRGWDRIPFPQMAGRSLGRHADGARDRGSSLEDQARVEHSVHLVLAGRRVGVRHDDARRRRPGRPRLLRRADGHRRFVWHQVRVSAHSRGPRRRRGAARRRGCESAASRSTCTISTTTAGCLRTRTRSCGHARRINDYAREFGCDGFRSGAMYREQDWFDAFEFSYDMSVPNAAHLEPQRGGCCTVMPYFVGNILELPLTTVQDYSLFHILERLFDDAVEGADPHRSPSTMAWSASSPIPTTWSAGASAPSIMSCCATWPSFAIDRESGWRCRARSTLVAKSAPDDADALGRAAGESKGRTAIARGWRTPRLKTIAWSTRCRAPAPIGSRSRRARERRRFMALRIVEDPAEDPQLVVARRSASGGFGVSLARLARARCGRPTATSRSSSRRRRDRRSKTEWWCAA